MSFSYIAARIANRNGRERHHPPRTNTFRGERYRRLVRRRGHQRALVAVARSILVVVWHLLADQDGRFVDLGPDFYERRLNKDRRARDLVRQLQALGHTVTLSPAA
jgi:transposase